MSFLNTGDRDLIQRCFAADYDDHDPIPGMPGGIDGVRSAAEMLGDHRLRVVFDLEDCLVDGDKVAYRISGYGSVASVEQAPADVFIVKGVGIFRVAGGLLSERWGSWSYQSIAG